MVAITKESNTSESSDLEKSNSQVCSESEEDDLLYNNTARERTPPSYRKHNGDFGSQNDNNEHGSQNSVPVPISTVEKSTLHYSMADMDRLDRKGDWKFNCSYNEAISQDGMTSFTDEENDNSGQRMTTGQQKEEICGPSNATGFGEHEKPREDSKLNNDDRRCGDQETVRRQWSYLNATRGDESIQLMQDLHDSHSFRDKENDDQHLWSFSEEIQGEHPENEAETSSGNVVSKEKEHISGKKDPSDQNGLRNKDNRTKVDQTPSRISPTEAEHKSERRTATGTGTVKQEDIRESGPELRVTKTNRSDPSGVNRIQIDGKNERTGHTNQNTDCNYSKSTGDKGHSTSRKLSSPVLYRSKKFLSLYQPPSGQSDPIEISSNSMPVNQRKQQLSQEQNKSDSGHTNSDKDTRSSLNDSIPVPSPRKKKRKKLMAQLEKKSQGLGKVSTTPEKVLLDEAKGHLVPESDATVPEKRLTEGEVQDKTTKETGNDPKQSESQARKPNRIDPAGLAKFLGKSNEVNSLETAIRSSLPGPQDNAKTVLVEDDYISVQCPVHEQPDGSVVSNSMQLEGSLTFLKSSADTNAPLSPGCTEESDSTFQQTDLLCTTPGRPVSSTYNLLDQALLETPDSPRITSMTNSCAKVNIGEAVCKAQRPPRALGLKLRKISKYSPVGKLFSTSSFLWQERNLLSKIEEEDRILHKRLSNECKVTIFSSSFCFQFTGRHRHNEGTGF